MPHIITTSNYANISIWQRCFLQVINQMQSEYQLNHSSFFSLCLFITTLLLYTTSSDVPLLPFLSFIFLTSFVSFILLFLQCIVPPCLPPKNTKLQTPFYTRSHRVPLFETHTLLSCLESVIRLNSYTPSSLESVSLLPHKHTTPTDRKCCITMPAGGVVARFLPSDARFLSCWAA